MLERGEYETQEAQRREEGTDKEMEAQISGHKNGEKMVKEGRVPWQREEENSGQEIILREKREGSLDGNFIQ